MRSVYDCNVNDADDGDAANRGVELRISPERVLEFVDGVAIPGVGVFGEDRENKPINEELEMQGQWAEQVCGAYQVKQNVSQYVILHDTSTTRAGSHIPREASSSVAALEARSIGTSMMTIDGSHRAKKMGTR